MPVLEVFSEQSVSSEDADKILKYIFNQCEKSTYVFTGW